MAQEDRSSVLFTQEGTPAVSQLVPLSLQHVVAAVVGIITPAIIVANAFGLDQADRSLLIQVSLVMAGVLSLLQSHPLFGFLGSGLPVFMGAAFAYVPTLTAVAGMGGIGAIFGAQVIGGLVAVVFGLFFKYIRRLFPPVVTGTVVFSIGLSLYTVAVGYMAGGAGAADFGSVRNWAVALVTLVACVAFANFGKGVLKLGSLLWGLLVGYGVSLALGMVSFDGLAQESWLALPTFMPFALEFQPAAIASLSIVFIVGAVQIVGDLNGACAGALDRAPTEREVTGAILSQGLLSVVGSFFGALPTGTYSQNIGIVNQNKVINKKVMVCACLIMLCAGLMPKVAFVLSGIPKAVIGGATINVFATITMTGVRLLTKDGLSQRTASAAGLSVALGMGIALTGGALAGPGMPEWVQGVLGSSSLVVTTVTAIVLNLVLPGAEKVAADPVPAAAAERGDGDGGGLAPGGPGLAAGA
ncbi:solute carrier family 23 protein [Atopobiaceae bacterium 24-176]